MATCPIKLVMEWTAPEQEDRQRKASPRLWTREVEVSEALAPKSLALLEQQVQAKPLLWSQEA